MAQFIEGDRVRIDEGGVHHGKHGTIVSDSMSGSVNVRLANCKTETFPIDELRPVPNIGTSLYYRERETLSNIWGDDIPEDIRQIQNNDLLWEMRRQISEAVENCYRDDDMDALGILGPLEYKLTEVLAEREGSNIINNLK